MYDFFKVTTVYKQQGCDKIIAFKHDLNQPKLVLLTSENDYKVTGESAKSNKFLLFNLEKCKIEFEAKIKKP